MDTNSDEQIKRLKKQLDEARNAVHWLWGFWDGNTLVLHQHNEELQEQIQEAFEQCLRAVEPI